MNAPRPHPLPEPDAPGAPEAVPGGEETSLRRCVASGESVPRERLIRFVVGPDDALVPDLKGRLPGRGLWITADRDMIATAFKRGLFAKAARRKVLVADDLMARLEGLLVRRVSELLGLAQAAGQVTQGYDAIESRTRGGRFEAGILVAASDASERGTSKFKGLQSTVPIIRPLTAGELGAALGLPDATYVAVDTGSFSERLLIEARRLEGFRK